MLFLEVILPNVSTTICETFICERFDDGRYLRAQLSLSCDSDEHEWYAAYASVMFVVYVVIVPALLFATLAYHRDEINLLMTAVYERGLVDALCRGGRGGARASRLEDGPLVLKFSTALRTSGGSGSSRSYFGSRSLHFDFLPGRRDPSRLRHSRVHPVCDRARQREAVPLRVGPRSRCSSTGARARGCSPSCSSSSKLTPLPGVLVGIALVAFAVESMLLLYYVSRANQHEAAQVEQHGDAPDDETPAPEDARTPTPPDAGGKARIRARSSAPASMGGGWSESESDAVQLTSIYAAQSFGGADNPMHGSPSEDDEAPEESERAQRELARESESAIATESHEI